MTVFYSVTESPIGKLTLTSDGTFLTGLYMEEHAGSRFTRGSRVLIKAGRQLAFGGDKLDSWSAGTPACPENSEVDPNWVLNDSVELFTRVKEQLSSYFGGTIKDFTVPIKPSGTDFQMKVWAELLNIPFGQVISYAELARRIDNPKACRAVGLANGQNPISIIVPCHRVIGANGKLTGYGGGLPRKALLLELEQPQTAKQLTLV